MAGSRSSRGNSSRGLARRACAAATAAALALAAAGCGDDEGDNGLKRKALAKRANAICKPHYEKITAEANKVLAGGRLPNPRQFGRLANGTIIPEYTKQIAELRTLNPADSVGTDYREWLKRSEAALVKIKKSPPLITDANNFKAVNAQATKLGLSQQCQVGPT